MLGRVGSGVYDAVCVSDSVGDSTQGQAAGRHTALSMC